MQGCPYLSAILFGLALTGCSPEVSEVKVNSGQFTGVSTGEIAGGFVQNAVAGGGGFGGTTPQSSESFEGEIAGDYVLLRSGGRIERYGGKGATPLVIKTEAERLPLVPGTDEVGEQLLKLSGSRVKLRGRTWTTVALGRGSKGGAAGIQGCNPRPCGPFPYCSNRRASVRKRHLRNPVLELTHLQLQRRQKSQNHGILTVWKGRMRLTESSVAAGSDESL